MMKRDKKDEEAGAITNPFANLDKTTVLQEARIFNETPIQARKASHVLTKLLYMLRQGTTLGRTEATEAFFAVTKLWQSKDTTLRRLVYLAIKELASMADDVIIVTSSLTKDMTGKEDGYRAAAIRALCKITDSSMLQAIERYMKQAVVDKVPAVASAALVSSLHLVHKSPDVVRRWANEVQEAVNSDNHMVQFHALGVLYQIRKSDKLAVSKLVSKAAKSGLRSPYAVCYLIRLSTRLIEEEASGASHPLFDFLESCLRHKCEVVIYEAASAIVRIPEIGSRELAPAIAVLQLFCSSPKPALRFAACRTLNRVAMRHPAAVTACNMDLEQLITDSNRSIATLAITTLLKTGAESSVDRLMKQISSFVSEISDEFKIVVIDAIRSLCMRYPRKHAVMMTFLSTMLRDEGGFDYKKAIVDTIITIIEENPEAKEAGLSHLCEFIEDCEHAQLATRILHLIGREGAKTPHPSRYIRFVYNRVILEQAQVRAAAVTALGKLGAAVADLRPSIRVLLNRCLLDTDDEVRDRATYFLAILRQDDERLNSQCIINGLQVSVPGLERALRDYCAAGPQAQPFDIRSVPVSATPITLEEKKPVISATEDAPVQLKKEEKAKGSLAEQYAAKLGAVPELSALNLGPLFRSSPPVELTESETEYVVSAVKHVFSRHLVLQFDLRNTLNDQLLETVRVVVEGGTDDGWEILQELPCSSLPYNEPGTAYTVLTLPEDPASQTAATFTCTLKFLVKDCDPNTGEPEGDEGYDDEYALEDVEISVADYVQRLLKPNFAAAWEELGEDNEVDDTYALTSITSLQEGVGELCKALGLGVCERSDKVAEGKSSHTLLLSGVFRGGFEVLVRAKMALNQQTDPPSLTLNLCVRSEDEAVSQIISSAIG